MKGTGPEVTPMGTTTAGHGRIVPSPRTLGLAVGDLLLIAAFVVSGAVSHFGVEYVLARPLAVAETAAPFYLGWLAAAPLAGAYGRAALAGPRSAARAVAAAWIGAALIGQLLRGTALFSGDLALPFVIVSLVVGLVLLVPWRLLPFAAAALRRR